MTQCISFEMVTEEVYNTAVCTLLAAAEGCNTLRASSTSVLLVRKFSSAYNGVPSYRRFMYISPPPSTSKLR